MNPRKRFRPMMTAKEFFLIPQVILIPAAVVSCALVPLILIEGSLPKSSAIGAGFAALVFAGLTFFVLLLPAIYAFALRQSSVEGTAVVLKKEKRSRILITPENNTSISDNIVTFEFTPQSASTPIRMEAEVGKVASRLTEGKKVKIVYASSNPRIVKFVGE